MDFLWYLNQSKILLIFIFRLGTRKSKQVERQTIDAHDDKNKVKIERKKTKLIAFARPEV